MALVPSPFTARGLLAGSFEPFATLHREVNRLFDDVLSSAPTPSAPAARSNMLLAPCMDVTETPNEVRIQAELPGVKEQDVEISLNDDVLSVRAEKRETRKEEREGTHFSERAFGIFQRSLRLPFAADPDKVQARMENGVLTVTVPKSPAKDRSRRIQIQGSQTAEAQQAVSQQDGGQQDGGQQVGGQARGQATDGQATGGQAGDGLSGQSGRPAGAEDGAIPNVSGASEDGAAAVG